jgi:16S rRNA (guanine527-N7)-methyltransferase
VTHDWLVRALEESRARGFLGPSPIEPQISHARGFARAWESRRVGEPRAFLDLGSGGGLPGLVLLEEWSCPGTLMDSMAKRVAFLAEVLEWDDAPRSGTALLGRAEEMARLPEFSGSFELVTARSFGPPAVVAECASRFLSVDGLLIVSEPPELVNRWPAEGLQQLGLENAGSIRNEAGFQILRKVRETPADFPRNTGVPKKRPLF